MKILRTPEQCFINLKDYPFEPNYTVIKTECGNDMRIHHIDEGPKDGPIILCMHGQPVWSYLYRKMIPFLNHQGIRVIAPDLPGYGKSDKPAARKDYSYQRQVDWISQWLEANDFNNLNLFGQDWGGLIGLRVIADHPERFDRVIISNTGLPYRPDVPEEIVQQVREFRENAKTPTLPEMARKLRTTDKDQGLSFAYWQKYCWETKDIPIGFMMSSMLERKRSKLSTMLDLLFINLGLKNVSPFQTELGKAYAAPFPNQFYKMGPRAMPSQVPTMPDDPSLEAQKKAWEFYKTFEKPFLCAFSDNDPVTRGADREFLNLVPGAQGQTHSTVEGGGHFIQEEKPEEISEIIINFISTTTKEVYK
jgi:haloalkane dehalogenase|tara:strand:- start:1451 stop:2539 length:1089 start_codon:yes stop_codon:yes gene_type:complete